MSQFNDNFLSACLRKPVNAIPVWFMRQAGRYQAEYREIRRKHSLISICKTPEVCARVTLLPVEQLNVDAAILFSDIMLPLEAMGVKFAIKENYGPIIENPIRSLHDVNALRSLNAAEDLNFLGRTIKILREQLSVPLIGFSGAPFTLSSYLIEGGASRTFIATKTMMYSQPEAWRALLERLTSAMIEYLKYQVSCGAQALQIFDSWVGTLSLKDYETYVFPHMKRLFGELKSLSVPLIHFGVLTGHLLELMKQAGGDVIGLDWRVQIDEAWRRLNYEVSIQGNLDPCVLFAPWNIIESKALQILGSIKRNGFIFNLGHGILPNTQVKHLQKLVELVHSYKLENL